MVGAMGFALVCVLAGCAEIGGDAYLVARAVRESMGSGPPLPDFSSGLSSKYRYLMVQVNDSRAAVLRLGFEELTDSGLLESWYSNDGVLIQTLNGRLASVQGLPVEWRSVRWQGTSGLALPSESSIRRNRDVVPGYVFDVADVMHDQASAFGDVPRAALAGQATAGYWSQFKWYKESVMTEPGSMALPASWFAVGTHRGMVGMVASYQCLEIGYCLKLARWPLESAPQS